MSTPDYADEIEGEDTASEIYARLHEMVAKMAKLQLRKMELEEEMAIIDVDLKKYKEQLIPSVMTDIGMDQITTKNGLKIVVKDEVYAAFPKDEARQAVAFAWLKETGNDGLIKREIKLNYGRGDIAWAEQLVKQLREMNVGDHCVMTESWNIHHQTLLAFIRGELKAGHEIPMEAFGAMVKRIAEIKK